MLTIRLDPTHGQVARTSWFFHMVRYVGFGENALLTVPSVPSTYQLLSLDVRPGRHQKTNPVSKISNPVSRKSNTVIKIKHCQKNGRRSPKLRRCLPDLDPIFGPNRGAGPQSGSWAPIRELGPNRGVGTQLGSWDQIMGAGAMVLKSQNIFWIAKFIIQRITNFITHHNN